MINLDKIMLKINLNKVMITNDLSNLIKKNLDLCKNKSYLNL